LLASYLGHFVKYGKADSPEANLSDLHRLQRETTPAGEAEAVFIGLFPVWTRPSLDGWFLELPRFDRLQPEKCCGVSPNSQ
jgi:hypothetical protein